MLSKQKKEKLSRMQVRSNYRLVFLSALGLAGIILSNINFFWICRHESLFQEIQFRPKEIIGGIIGDSLRVIEARIQRWEDTIPRDSVKLKARPSDRQYKADTSKRTHLYRYKIQSANMSPGDSLSFSTLNKSVRFNINLEQLHRWEEFPDSPRIGLASFYEPITGFRADTLVRLETVPFTRNLDFFNRYPGFARHFFIVFIFSGFCFISVATCIYLTARREQLFKEYRIDGHSQRDYFVFAGAMIVLLSLIAWLWECTFYDASVIKDMYFMESFSNRIIWMKVLGVVAGAFCLAGFLHSGILLDFFKKQVRHDKREKRSGENNEVIIPAGAEPALAREESDTEVLRNKDLYESMGKTFQGFFILSAVVLSLMVLCAGSLYSAVNSLDFIKLVADDFGYSPVRWEFVYLYGALYTLILLIIYVPAHMRMKDIKFDEVPAPAEGRWWDFGKSLFDDLKSVLVAVSPLLTGLLQSFYDFLFN